MASLSEQGRYGEKQCFTKNKKPYTFTFRRSTGADRFTGVLEQHGGGSSMGGPGNVLPNGLHTPVVRESASEPVLGPF